MKKKLYKIGDLTKLLGITSRTIRYYDQLGLLPFVKRSDGHVRLFDDEDIALIKKIRLLQKSDRIPLERIKSSLYASDSTQLEKTIVVVDSLSLPLDQLNSSHLPLKTIPFRSAFELNDENGKLTKSFFDGLKIGAFLTESPSQDELVKFYKDLKTQGFEKVYSFHIGAHYSFSFKNAKAASEQVSDILDVRVIDSQTFGAALGLLAWQVAELVAAKRSFDEIDITISKHLSIAYQVMCASSLEYILNRGILGLVSSIYNLEPLTQSLLSFRPLISLTHPEQLDVIDLIKPAESIQHVLENCVLERLQTCGGYMTKAVISHHNMLSLAQLMKDYIRSNHSQADIVILEDYGAMGLLLGPECLSISMV